jgi:hypothetical protein
MNVGDLMALRLRAQMLSGPPATDPVAVVERLLAVQAQDPRGFRLAVRSRTSGGSTEDLERALSEERSLVVTTLNRGTLHLVRSQDYWWLHPLTTPQLHAANARRLAQTGVRPDQAERGVVTVVDALRSEGPLGRQELRRRLDAEGVPTAGQTLVHVLLLSSLRGFTVRGPLVEGEHAWALVADWLGTPPVFDRDDALARMARRYLAGHGPAGDRDLARWSGLSLREARAGLASIADEVVRGEGGLVSLADAPVHAELPAPRLLGPFEPVLLGWCDREPIVGPNRGLVTVNGIFRPFALVDGRAVGSWGLDANCLTIRPFRPLSPATMSALTSEAVAVASYLGRGPPRVVLA